MRSGEKGSGKRGMNQTEKHILYRRLLNNYVERYTFSMLMFQTVLKALLEKCETAEEVETALREAAAIRYEED